jgi:hypothetical protein
MLLVTLVSLVELCEMAEVVEFEWVRRVDAGNTIDEGVGTDIDESGRIKL